jgi:quercetin dioxygenase-like cupin family protein
LSGTHTPDAPRNLCAGGLNPDALPEVSVILEGTLTNTVKGQPPKELSAGAPVLNGPEVEHLPANQTDKPLVIISVDLIKK